MFIPRRFMTRKTVCQKYEKYIQNEKHILFFFRFMKDKTNITVDFLHNHKK